MSKTKKGWICLDIDGTITEQLHSIPKTVLDYLRQCHHQGWNIVFVTGRIFSLAHEPLKELDYPYYLVPHNGAVSFYMPEQKLLHKQYLPINAVFEVLKRIESTPFDLVLYTGIDQGEKGYYRPGKLQKEILHYIENTLKPLAGQWIPLSDYTNIPEDAFPYVKIYGQMQPLKQVYEDTHSIDGTKIHLVTDSINPQNGIMQIMHHEVDKGKAVLKLIENDSLNLPIIGAGNDRNDETLLDISTVKIAMEGSPKSLIDRAHLVAPSVQKDGIIEALKWAIEHIGK